MNQEKRKIGLLGGTFDPVHLGHLRMAQQCREKLKLDEVWFMPALEPPHKDNAISPYEKRRRWLELALEGQDWCRICDIEQQLTGKSYTWRTLQVLREQEPDCQFYFLTGADSLYTLEKWYHWQDILDLCCFVATSRPGYDIAVPETLAQEAQKRQGDLICLEIDALDVSSTLVREKIVRKADISQLVPAAIQDEVKESMEIQVEGYKELLKKRLSPKRYTHSVGVANTAAKLAGMYGGDIQRAYLAGLLHDYCRETPSSELLDLAAAHDLFSDPVELLQPDLLHGAVGAWQLREQGILEDEAVLQAITWHTTGHPDMDQLARIIYIADYTEPGRTFPGAEDLRRVVHRDLNLGVLAGLDHTISYLLQRGKLLHPWSVAARNRLIEELGSHRSN